jgi:hypothetical protein
MRLAPARHDPAPLLDELEIERTSGVFLRAPRAPRPASPCGAEDIARAVQALTRTWAAVLLTPTVRLGASANVYPAPARPDDSGFSLVMRLSAWLPQAGDTARPLAVPAYVRKWMPIEAALVVPIQVLRTVGWIAIPHTGSTRDVVREVEAIASGAALDLESAERRDRLASLASGR